MTETRHTPGPWSAVKPRNPYLQSWTVEGQGSRFVAECFQYADKQAEGNAALIAAAPDLLSALQETARYLEHIWSGDGPARQRWLSIHSTVHDALAAALPAPTERGTA